MYLIEKDSQPKALWYLSLKPLPVKFQRQS